MLIRFRPIYVLYNAVDLNEKFLEVNTCTRLFNGIPNAGSLASSRDEWTTNENKKAIIPDGFIFWYWVWVANFRRPNKKRRGDLMKKSQQDELVLKADRGHQAHIVLLN